MDDRSSGGRKIYPQLKQFNLHSEFVNTEYEWLFIGTFVDRCKTTALVPIPATPIWDPLKIAKFPSRSANRSIYVCLMKTVHALQKLLNEVSYSLKYSLVLYMDMHLPLVIEIENQIEKNTKMYTQEKKVDAIWNSLGTVQWNNGFDYDVLGVFTDAHMLTEYSGKALVQDFYPSIDLFSKGHGIFHEGMLDDVLTDLSCCSFFNDKRSENPITHLLSKALPQRCTIRNLKDILSKYVREHDNCYSFVLGCMKASLLGVYKSSQIRPAFSKRKCLIRVFQSLTKPMLISFINSDHQQLLFFIIKEFTVFGVSKLPAILSQLQRHYHWTEFEESVRKAMNIVRRYDNFDPRDPFKFKHIESQFVQINKSQVHHLYRPHRSSFSKTVLQECERLDDAECLNYVTKYFKSEHKELMWQLAIRYESKKKQIPLQWLEYFNFKKENIQKITSIQDNYLFEGSKTNLKAFLKQLDRASFETLRAFCDVFERRINYRMYTLPAHIYVLQIKAIRRKYHIPNGQPLGSQHGTALVCLHCKTFKSFVNKIVKGKTKNLMAYGHRKVLIDDDTMELYCGKRSEKLSDGKKRTLPDASIAGTLDHDILSAANERVKKRTAKEIRKELKNNLCSQTKLKSINLIGRVLQFYGVLYTVCPSCGNFMEYSNKYFLKDTFYCGGCLSDNGELFSSIKCLFCKVPKKNDWTPVTCMEDGEYTTINLCQDCHKPWIQTSGILQKSLILEGLRENWKRLQHPANL